MENTETPENNQPCQIDHNGECLICDCWLVDCAFERFKKQDFKYETPEQLSKMFKNYLEKIKK